MYNRNYALSTLSSYVSALVYSHKFLSYSDPTKAFFIVQMLKGYNKLGYRLDARLPITLLVLQKLIESSAALSISEYQCCQFGATCTTAFFAFLRIGDMTYNSAKDASNPILQAHHVSKLVDFSKYVVAPKITFGNTATTNVPLKSFCIARILVARCNFCWRKKTGPTFPESR